MNEEAQTSIYGSVNILSTIVERMLLTRPKMDVYISPYDSIATFDAPLGCVSVDLYRLFPEAVCGDTAYVDFSLYCHTDYEIFIGIHGNCALYHDETLVYPLANTTYTQTENRDNVPLKCRQGMNPISIKCVCDGETFSVTFNVSVQRYPGMWANDYLLYTKMYCPNAPFDKEEGVAVRAVTSTGLTVSEALACDIEKQEYIYPKLTAPALDISHVLDGGEMGYIYTVPKVDTMISGKNIRFIRGNPSCTAGEEILLEVTDESALDINFADFHLPFLYTNRDIPYIYIGGFSAGDISPATDLYFDNVYKKHKGESTYWKTPDGSLRIYLDSAFYGQWFYALMVGFAGILKVGQYADNQDLIDLFNGNMLFMAKYFDYVEYDAKLHNMPAFMPRCVNLDNLDAIGTMGMNFADSYMLTKNSKLLPIIELLYKSLRDNIMRTEMGAFRREDTMWADDIYMSLPFLLRYGQIFDDPEVEELILTQLREYKRMLFIEDEQVFSHIFFFEDAANNGVPWGRGNGWILLTLSDLLLQAKGELYDVARSLFAEFSCGILRCQGENGLWHQVLNQPSTYFETSCTAMFVTAFARGTRLGILGEEYKKSALLGWDGLLKHQIDHDGNVYGVCMGSGRSRKWTYYANIPTVKNDDHGTGIVLLAGCEVALISG